MRGSVLQNCLVSVGSVTFPNAGIGYIHNSGNVVLTQSSLGMRCTKGAVAQISMNTGLYGSKAGTQFGSRSMKSTQGKNYLGYDLCHDSACASVWSPAAYTYTSATDKGSSLPVWGRIKTGQQADSGTYADSVTVTVSF
ncbi:MAG TPA: spore coat U domain-containing protein [Candidatus Baltobacteraceae bacterium]|nr:spore coat U domain-containing protein [Candidatus Baltobacteraceae bacterium]